MSQTSHSRAQGHQHYQQGQGSSLNASQSSLTQVTRTSSMDSLESSMSTTESNAGEVEANRLVTVLQENAVLRSELEVMKLRCKNLMEENRRLRQASVTIQAQAEQEEEFISNTLLKKIHCLKKEKEALAMNYEQEEEFLTNDLSRKLAQLRQEKVQLEQTLEQEQEQQIAKLTKKIERLEKETHGKQNSLDKLRREKVDLENTLEQEQELLVNKLWKRMDKVEQEKRELEARLGATPPPSPSGQNSPAFLNSRILQLSGEVDKLKRLLSETRAQSKERIQQIEEEEKALKEENIRLQRRLLRETERREQMTRQLSESESSLEMDEERYFNEVTSGKVFNPSSPSPYSPSPTRRSLSPSPALFVAAGTVGYPPTSPLRGRAQSFGAYNLHGNPHLQSVSASHLPPVHSNGAAVVSERIEDAFTLQGQ